MLEKALFCAWKSDFLVLVLVLYLVLVLGVEEELLGVGLEAAVVCREKGG